MSKTKLSTFQIGAAYIGTVVGAGFASGQEVLQFFGYFGYYGILGLFISTVLFIFFGYLVLLYGKNLEATSHRPVIKHAAGKWLGSIIDMVITFFLFGALTAMAAGAGAVFSEQLALPSLLGSGLMSLITVGTVLLGFNGVISAISFVVPLLLAVVIGISFLTIQQQGLDLVNATGYPRAAAVPFWPLSAIVYVSYNIVMAVAILAPMGKQAANYTALGRGAIWGGLGLGLGAMSILLALLALFPQVTDFAIPMAYIAGQISPTIQILFSIVLFAEIYTTAVGSLYGFAARLIDIEAPQAKWYIISAGIVAFGASLLGFTNLVRILYPAVGYAGLILLGGLLWRSFKNVAEVWPLFGKRPREE